jgi:hypothetical protein
MRLTFDHDRFVAAVKWALLVVDRKKPGSSVSIQPSEDGRVVVFGADDGRANTAVVDAVVDDPADLRRIDLSAVFLKKSIDRFMDDSLVLESKTADTKIMSGITVSVPMMTGAWNKPIDLKSYRKIGTLDPRDLSAAVKKLLTLTDSTTQDKRFSTIDFTFAKGSLGLMATDRFSLSVRTLAYDYDDDCDDARMLIPGSGLSALTAARDAQTVTVYHDDSSSVFVFDSGETARIDLLQEEPQEYAPLVYSTPREHEHSFTVDESELLNLVNTADALSESTPDVIIQAGPDGGELWNKDETLHAPLALADVDFDKPMRFRFQTVIISETLACSDGGRIKVRFVDAVQPIVFSQVKEDGSVDDSVYILSVPVDDSAAVE